MIASSRELSLAHVNSVASGHLARNRPPWHECIAGSAVFVVNAVDRQGGRHDEIIPVVRDIGGLEGAMAMVMLLSDA